MRSASTRSFLARTREGALGRYALGSCLWLVGCGSEGSDVTADRGDQNEETSPGSSCELINETQPCTCSELKGVSTCKKDGWSECTCALPEGGTVTGSVNQPGDSTGTPAGNLRSDIMFEWERTAATEGSCEPGYYEGTFSGLYTSQLTFVGVPIPVVAVSIPGKPGLSFTLTKKPGSGEELVIENGIMDGLADGAFPFKGTLTGTLNCETLRFNAILDGYYSLGLDGIGMWQFKGPLEADYDKAMRSVVNATWKVDEYFPPPMTVLPAGGMGDWSASWIRP